MSARAMLIIAFEHQQQHSLPVVSNKKRKIEEDSDDIQIVEIVHNKFAACAYATKSYILKTQKRPKIDLWRPVEQAKIHTIILEEKINYTIILRIFSLQNEPKIIKIRGSFKNAFSVILTLTPSRTNSKWSNLSETWPISVLEKKILENRQHGYGILPLFTNKFRKKCTTNGKSELNSQSCFARFGRYSAVAQNPVLPRFWVKPDSYIFVENWIKLDKILMVITFTTQIT